jgi:hypothetical protein
MWHFLDSVFSYLLNKINHNQKSILRNQQEIKELIMSVKVAVEQMAAKVNEFSNQLAAAITTIAAQFEGLKSQLVDATTPAEVEAIMATPLANLEAAKNSLVELAANNQPTIPAVPPVEPVEPL